VSLHSLYSSEFHFLYAISPLQLLIERFEEGKGNLGENKKKRILHPRNNPKKLSVIPMNKGVF